MYVHKFLYLQKFTLILSMSTYILADKVLVHIYFKRKYIFLRSLFSVHVFGHVIFYTNNET